MILLEMVATGFRWNNDWEFTYTGCLFFRGNDLALDRRYGNRYYFVNLMKDVSDLKKALQKLDVLRGDN